MFIPRPIVAYHVVAVRGPSNMGLMFAWKFDVITQDHWAMVLILYSPAPYWRYTPDDKELADDPAEE